VWLAIAVGLHLALASAASAADLPQTLQFYGLVSLYAAPAALGLVATGRLAPWRAIVWAALVVAANAAAVSLTMQGAPGYGEPAWKIAWSGGLGGLAGAGLSLFGLIALRGVRPLKAPLLWAAAGSAVLAVLGGGLCLALLIGGIDLLHAFALPVVLYLPWQVVFSLLVARISPARAGSWPSDAPARSARPPPASPSPAPR
jgi:hypothetical protein